MLRSLSSTLLILSTLIHASTAAEPVPSPDVGSPPATPVAVTATASLYTAADLDAFLAKADALQLDRSTHWRTLLHIAHGRSLVDAPEFFLAPNGKHDPRAELRADLTAFFTDRPNDPKAATNRFPGRLEWLCAQLGIDRERLPVPRSTEFETAFGEFGARRVSLAFPSAYMNSPASMFGHTMLIINSRFTNQLLSQGVNYGALTNNDNGIAQAFKGLLGFYPGYYTLMPYYQLVQEYTDLDQRDIWEYPLNLTEPEIRALMLHVWDLRGMWSSYFFFDENCSYNLMYLLDAARPGLELHNQANQVWVIPFDTVQLARKAGLITDTVYRPSRASRVRHLANQLSAEDQELAHGLAYGTRQMDDVKTRPHEQQARILDLASEYLQSLRGRKKISQADYQARYHACLMARSGISAPALTDRSVLPPPAPERGHNSCRISLGGGRQWGANFAELGVRPAYHNLDEAGNGFQPGTQVEFLSLLGRWYADEDHPNLERADVIRLRSYAARDRFFQPISYAVDTGITRERFDDGEQLLYQGYLSGGAGFTWDFGHHALFTTLLEADIRVGGPDAHYTTGIGPSAGLALPLPGNVRLHPEVRILRYPLGILATNWEGVINANWSPTQNLAISVEAARRQRWDLLDTAGSIKFLFYF